MSKGLDALKEFETFCKENGFATFDGVFHPTGKCKKYDQSYKTVEKELKALEIIKEKKVNVVILMGCDSLEEYNKHSLTWHHLTQEEYDLLKEVLL